VAPPPTDVAGVTLEPFSLDRAPTTWGWLQDDELRAQIDSASPPTEEENLRYWERRLRDDREHAFAIFRRGEHVGNCGLIVDAARRKAELWIYLGTARGAGVGTEAVEHLLRLAFDQLELNRVFLRALESNAAAMRFWRGRGFVEEGRAREDTWIADRPIDSIWFSMLRNEWLAR
jgi:diamine N-acetyltransferase